MVSLTSLIIEVTDESTSKTLLERSGDTSDPERLSQLNSMYKVPKQPLETSEIKLVKPLFTLELLIAINRNEEPVISETPKVPAVVTGPDQVQRQKKLQQKPI